MRAFLPILLAFLSYSFCFAQISLFPADILKKQNISIIKKYSECPGCNPVKEPWITDSLLVDKNGLVTVWFRFTSDGSIRSKHDYSYSNKGDYSFKATSYPPIGVKDTIGSHIEKFKFNRKGQLIKSLKLFSYASSLTELRYKNGKAVKELSLLYSNKDLNQLFKSNKNTLTKETATRVSITTYHNDSIITKIIHKNEELRTHVVIYSIDSIIEYEYDKDGILNRTTYTFKNSLDKVIQIKGTSLRYNIITGGWSGQGTFNEEFTYGSTGLLIQLDSYVDDEISRIFKYAYY